jgi:hypothetical protein
MLVLSSKLRTKCCIEPRTWTHPLDERPKLRIIGLIFGTLNVKSLYRAGLLITGAKELSEYIYIYITFSGRTRIERDRGVTEPKGEYIFSM